MIGFVVRNALRSGLQPKTAVQVSKRNSGHAWYYRKVGSPAKIEVVGSTVLGTFMWWWILWHVITEPEHLFGHFPYPDPNEWTDNELGIPPDDE